MPVRIMEYTDYVEGGQRLTGLADLATYRKAIESA